MISGLDIDKNNFKMSAAAILIFRNLLFWSVICFSMWFSLTIPNLAL